MENKEISEDMLRLFEMMKMELDKQTKIITQNITATLMSSIENKITPLIEENKHLKAEIETLNKKVKYLENTKRINNIIIHGIKETEHSQDDLFNIIKDTLQNINIKVEKNDINKYYRLGKKEGNKTRPILISLISNLKKVEIIKNKNKMAEKTYITEDFSKETLDLRRNLQQQLQVEKEKGNEAFIKNNKIIVKGKSDAEKRKRELSTSPTDIKSPQPAEKEIIKAPSKMHKTDAFTYMKARSLSLSEKGTQQQKA